MSREIMQQALDHLAALADDLRRIPSDIAQTIAALESELANYEKPLPPVDIGVDVTPEGTHVVACYNRHDAVQEMFYSQFHPLAKPERECDLHECRRKVREADDDIKRKFRGEK